MHIQRFVHFVEGLLSLLKKPKNDRPTEFALVLVVVHLEDLLESQDIDAIAKIRETDRTSLAL
jgi:hypothetical protein